MSDFEFGIYLGFFAVILSILGVMFAWERNWFGLPRAWNRLKHWALIVRLRARLR